VRVETQEQADDLNKRGEYGPYLAANGHLMVAHVEQPRNADTHQFSAGGLEDDKWQPDYCARCGEHRDEGCHDYYRPYRVGDRIRYDSWSAWCAKECHHDAPPPDW
jgi:hypothetical protein